jgi:hypothetical protein
MESVTAAFVNFRTGEFGYGGGVMTRPIKTLPCPFGEWRVGSLSEDRRTKSQRVTERTGAKRKENLWPERMATG